MKNILIIISLFSTITFTGCNNKGSTEPILDEGSAEPIVDEGSAEPIVDEGSTEPILDGPDWEAIKSNATFIVPDGSYSKPYIQSLNVGGWEDGLYISRDGLNLYAYFMPVDVFSLYKAWAKQPMGFNYEPYYRPPMIGVDMISNPWGNKNFFQGDIIIANRGNISSSFMQWKPSNLQRSISNEGAPCGVLKDTNTYDVFVFRVITKSWGSVEKIKKSGVYLV